MAEPRRCGSWSSTTSRWRSSGCNCCSRACAGVTVVGTANDGEAALRIAEAVAPDLVLLDIAMPGMDGIDVARALSASAVDPAVIFVTAFDNFAVAAFDVAAIDYLMKPVAARPAGARARPGPRPSRRRRRAGARPGSGHVEEFWVPDHSGLVRIAASDIQRITAERDYMRLHVGAALLADPPHHRQARGGSRSRLVHARPPLGDPAPRHDHRPLSRRGRPLDRPPRRRRRAAHRPLLCRRGEAVRRAASGRSRFSQEKGRRRWGTAASQRSLAAWWAQ